MLLERTTIMITLVEYNSNNNYDLLMCQLNSAVESYKTSTDKYNTRYASTQTTYHSTRKVRFIS